MDKHFDCIVVGAGGIGSSAFYFAAKGGLNVLAIDQFAKAHNRGSSHGQSRIIRQGYFEHPNYVPMVLDSYGLWEELESETGQTLKVETGLLEIGPPDGTLICGILKSAKRYNIAVDQFTNAESRKQFPLFHIPDDSIAIFERQAGYLAVERCVATYIDRAIELGGTYLPETPVTRIEYDDKCVTVVAGNQRYVADHAIIAAGAWSNQLLSEMELNIEVVRKHQYWIEAPNDQWWLRNGAPLFFYDLHGEYFYGIPAIENRGIKLAEHSGRKLVSDPTNVDRTIDTDDQMRVMAFAEKFLRIVEPNQTGHCVCMYSMTADEHFIVDRHPHCERIVFAAGMSGHGFKFAPVIGRHLMRLSVGDTDDSVDTFGFLKVNRINS
jgi:sarcosine oxidase